MDGHGSGSGVGEEMWRWEMRAEITSSGHRLATILSKIKNSEKAREDKSIKITALIDEE